MDGWPATLLLLLAPLACAPAGGQEAPAAAAAATAATSFSAAEVAALGEQAATAIEAAAGLKLQQPVPALLLTAAQARERRKAFAAALPAESGSTAAVDLMADFMFSESMLGRYLPDEKALYVISDVLERVAARGGRGDRQAAEDVLFGVLAHELTHAYDDQTYHLIPQPSDIKELVLDPTGLVEIQARMSLLEGRATWIAELACARVGRPPLETLSLDEARSAEVLSGRADEGGAQAVGRGLVNAIGRAKLVQYAYGREFARRAWAFGGEKFFAEVVTHLPLTLAELEDFELFRQRWAREKEAELEAAPAVAPAPADATAPQGGG